MLCQTTTALTIAFKRRQRCKMIFAKLFQTGRKILVFVVRRGILLSNQSKLSPTPQTCVLYLLNISLGRFKPVLNCNIEGKYSKNVSSKCQNLFILFDSWVTRFTDFYDFSEPFSDLLWFIQTWRHQRHDSTLLLVFLNWGSNFKFIAKKFQCVALISRAL